MRRAAIPGEAIPIFGEALWLYLLRKQHRIVGLL